MNRLYDETPTFGSTLLTLGQLLSGLLSGEGEGGYHQEHIKLASDASILLLDFHHRYSVLRRDLVALNLRKDLKDTLTNVSVDGWLFGSDLVECIMVNIDI